MALPPAFKQRQTSSPILSGIGYFRLFLTLTYNVRYTSKSRPSLAKVEFSAVFVSCASNSGPDSDQPGSAGVDPAQTCGPLRRRFAGRVGEAQRRLSAACVGFDEAGLEQTVEDKLIGWLVGAGPGPFNKRPREIRFDL